MVGIDIDKITNNKNSTLEFEIEYNRCFDKILTAFDDFIDKIKLTGHDDELSKFAKSMCNMCDYYEDEKCDSDMCMFGNISSYRTKVLPKDMWAVIRTGRT